MFNLPTYFRKTNGTRHSHLVFKSAKSKTGSRVNLNWHELTYALQSACHKVTESKLDVDLFSPWSPKTDSYGRTKDCAESTALLAFDLDKIDVMDIRQISDWCSPYANFIHTTYSHGTNDKGCFRVYIPLECAIPIEQYQSVHAHTLETLPEIRSRIDASSADAARCFFMPSCSAKTAALAEYLICFSEIYAPATLLNAPRSQISTPSISPTATQGNRNSRLASYCGSAYARGLTPQDLMNDAMNWGLACDPPLSVNEIESVVWSMWHTHGRNNPIKNRVTPKFLRSAAELKNDPPLEWVVRNILPSKGIGAIYGQPSSGKTFLALDLAFAISTGNAWFSNPALKRSVAYIALEGSHGIRQRIKAWEKVNGVSTPNNFQFVTIAVSVEDDHTWNALSKEIRNTLGLGSVIFVDTLNRASPTADENGSASMGKIIEAAKRMADEVEGFVMFIHHAGKDSGKGMRGHSSLLAALDTVIKVGNSNNQRIWSLEKSKDSEIGTGNAFLLETTNLDSQDSWGSVHTSCTIVHDLLIPTRTPITGKNQIQVIEVLESMKLDNPNEEIPLKALIQNVANALKVADPKRARERSKAAIDALVNSGLLTCTNGYISQN